MYRLARVSGYLALVATAGALVGSTLVTPGEIGTGTLGLEFGIVLVGGVAAVAERKRAFGQLETTTITTADAVDVLAVVVGTVLTYGLSVSVGLGPVLASALVGLVAGCFVSRVAGPVYCGTFVGMASPALFSSVESLTLAGLVAGLVYVATQGTFTGMGGKLGTIALVGCVATVLVTGADFGIGNTLEWSRLWVIVPVAVAGAVSTVVLSVRFELGAVVGSAVVGIVAGVAFPLLLPEVGDTLAAVAFCASFAGMSATDRLRTEVHVAFAGVVCGIVFVAVAPTFVGAGGKLGTIAFVSCLTAAGVSEVCDRLFSDTKRW